jgi:hypothetical protein
MFDESEIIQNETIQPPFIVSHFSFSFNGATGQLANLL